MSESSPAPRIGDRDRHRALDVLSTAYAEGRLTSEEFEERTSAALAVGTAGDLDVLLADLPVPGPAPLPAAATGGEQVERLVAVMSGAERRGRWVAPPQVTAVAVMGGVHIDFRGAEVRGPVVHVNAVTLMGGIEIVVPDDWAVTMSGLAFMGGRDVQGEPATAAPVVHLRVSGWAVMGGVSVQYRPRSSELPRGGGTAAG